MSEQQLTEGILHDHNGKLKECGWATSLVKTYNRSRIKASKFRIKEWDYYLINDNDYAIALTLGDLGYMGLISASLVDYKQKTAHTESVISPLPLGRFNLPTSSESGVSRFDNGRVSFMFEVNEGIRKLKVQFCRFKDGETLVLEVTLDNEPQDSMVIATPWKEDPTAFYYNQKIVAMRACGSFKLGSLVHGFSPADSFGLLDWGRGVWTRDNTWYWAVAQGLQSGTEEGGVQHTFGLNLGYGFGDTSAASENMVFVDGIAHKLHRVDFGIPQKKNAALAKKTEDALELMECWHVTDDENRLDLTFTPVLDRVDWMDFKVVRSDQHQVFGTFSGTVVLDDGSTFNVSNLLGSAEVIHNTY